MTASPSGRTVFVTEESHATVAYRAATGARLWLSSYNGPGNSVESAVAVIAWPGQQHFVRHREQRRGQLEFGLGHDRLQRRDRRPAVGGHDGPVTPPTLALSPDGKTV